MPDLSEITALPTASGAGSQPEVVLGTLVRFDEAGAPLVDWPGNPGRNPVPALSTAAYTLEDAARTAALLFAGGDPARPLIIGLVREPMDAVFEATVQGAAEEADVEATGGRPFAARADGDRVVISAEKEIVLQCGKASITLTRAGKILLRGAYLLSRSSGANKIKGGLIELN